MASPLLTGDVGTYPLSGNAAINPLLVWGYKWGNNPVGTPLSITYSFPAGGATWLNDYYDQEPFHGFQPFSDAQQDAARTALSLWSKVANITFTEVADTPDDVGEIRFGNSAVVTNSSSAAWAYLPFKDNQFQWPENGDVWFDNKYQPNLQLQPGQFGFSTMIHEIGHAIGLDHPFADAPNELAVPAAQANQRYSIMAYNRYSGATIEAYAPMLYDIAAIQYLYGANMETGKGDDVYTFLTNKEYLECIWDAGGHDSIDLSNQTRNQVIDLRAGTFSSIGIKNNGQTGNGNVSIAFNVTIEDAVGGTGHDKITGNDVANMLDGSIGNDTLIGGAGNDTLDGAQGADSMTGGLGDDLYLVDNAGDKVIETAGQGFDTVKSMVSFNVGAGSVVELLELVGAGNLNATGSASANTLIGNNGDNILDGGGGADTLKGGAGKDTYILDNAGDVVIEEGADVGDTVKSSALSLVAFAGIENYIFTGTKAWTFTGDGADNMVSSGSGNDNLDGAGGNDTLIGGAGNDTLGGGAGDDFLDGGLGNDKMKGGDGNDTYVINVATDIIDEESNLDTKDVVRSSVTVNLLTLAGGAIENAVLLGALAINATGNDSDNTLTGNIAANILNGGKGADAMTGDKGGDTYFVDNAGDTVIETVGGAAGGIDIVKSSVTFDLSTLGFVENVTLTENGNVNAIGNGLNNILIGNSGANRLDGGIGNDTMTGNAGSDTYVVNAVGDIVNELVLNSKGGGIDTVESMITYSLAARTNIENLTLFGTAKNGTGNALSNLIIGNAVDNILDGGTGADVLKGGAGSDLYIFDNINDTANEEANNDAADAVKTSATIAAAFTGIENYTYTGAKAWSFTGNDLNNVISGGTVNDSLDGGDGSDTLLGNGGNDTLIGGKGDDWLDGGIGNDKMKGGEGKDTYIVNAAGDTVEDDGGDADDLVKSSVTVSLLSGSFLGIEDVILTGAVAINATGNDKDNELTGNAAANVLNGGVGADKMSGGNGADTYFVDSIGDQVIEATAGAAGGIDTIKSTIDFNLSSIVNVENLTLVGSGNINAIGTSGNNVLIGNIGGNKLDGGLGNDAMTGGEGDDYYIVNSAGDIVNELVLNNKSGGHDTVESTVTFSLAARTNIEDLILEGAGNINGTGNALNNEITGNDGKNTLDGGAGHDTLDGGLANDILVGGIGNDFLHGGAGADKQTGGTGSDTFDFDLLTDLGDTITDFSKAAGDKIDILELLDAVNYVKVTDIFTDGYVSLTQNGTTTNILFDQDGVGATFTTTTLASLLNVNIVNVDLNSFITETV